MKTPSKLGALLVQYIFIFDWSDLMTLQKAMHTGQHVYIFVIRILSTYLTHLSFNFLCVCCCSRHLSLWAQLRFQSTIVQE